MLAAGEEAHFALPPAIRATSEELLPGHFLADDSELRAARVAEAVDVPELPAQS